MVAGSAGAGAGAEARRGDIKNDGIYIYGGVYLSTAIYVNFKDRFYRARVDELCIGDAHTRFVTFV